MKYVLIPVAAMLLFSCTKNNSDTESQPQSVYVVTPVACDGYSERSFSGIVEESSQISLGFKTAGELNGIYVKEGQKVNKGQLLATLDDTDYKLGVEALQIQYDQVSDEVKRTQKLFEKKSITANDYEKAEAGLKQLAVQLQINKNKLAYTKLYSPVSGTIESVNFSVGEMIDAGTAVFTLLDMSEKCVVVNIPAVIYARLDDISRVVCKDNGAEYAMRVLSVVPKADNTQLYRMKLGFNNDARKVTPGMNMDAVIYFASREEAGLRLPQSAIFLHNGKENVWVLNSDSTVSMRPVIVNYQSAGASVEISAGINEADRVVRAGVRRLHEGEKVRVIDTPSATNVGGLL